MKLKIKHVHLHKAMSAPAFPDPKRTLNDHHYPGMKMSFQPEGVLCEYKSVMALIPFVCIECVIMEKEADAKKS